MDIFTTGDVAHRLRKSRESVIQDLRRAGIEPLRDSAGRRLLTEDDVQRLLALRQNRRRLEATPR